MTPLNKKIIEDFNYALIKSFGEEFNNVDPQVSIAKDTRHADYQVNIAFSLAKKLKKKTTRNFSNNHWEFTCQSSI